MPATVIVKDSLSTSYCSYTHELKQLTNLFFENSNVFFKRLEHYHHHRSCLRCITMFSLGLTFFKNNLMFEYNAIN